MKQLAYPMIAGLVLMTASHAWSQNEAPASKADEADLAFEESIRDFGYLSGAALQCLPQGAGRLQHEREVLKAYDGLVRLFGSDRAFYYAAAFGAGSVDAIDKSKCSDYKEKFSAAMKSSRKQ